MVIGCWVLSVVASHKLWFQDPFLVGLQLESRLSVFAVQNFSGV